MDYGVISILMFFTLVGLLFLGVPVAFALGGVSIWFGWAVLGFDFFSFLPLRIYGVMENYTLMAVTLFIFMGVTLEKSGIAQGLIRSMAQVFGRFKGGLVFSVIAAGAMLAACTGIVGASVVTLGLIALPVMIEDGYDKKYSCGLVCACGTLGQITPPSIVLVLLGDIVGVAVGDLFIASLIPGLILVALYALFSVILFRRVSQIKEVHQLSNSSISEFVLSFVSPLILILLVLGSIFTGFSSPTEASAMGCMGALVLTFINRQLSFNSLKEILDQTIKLTAMVFFILLGATSFGLVFRGLEGDEMVKTLVESLPAGVPMFLLIVMTLIFFLGCFLDFIEIVFIVIPIIMPALEVLEINKLWFCILVAMNLQTSFLTPPLGFSLFYLKGVVPDNIKTSDIYKGVVPYLVIQIFVLTILIIFPELVTWLPEYMSS